MIRFLPIACAALVLCALPATRGDAGTTSGWSRRTLPEATLVDQSDAPRRLYADLLRGRRVAIGTFFTGCSALCPLLVENLEALRRRAGPDTAVVALSVDPENDTPERLADFARAHGLGLPLLTGDPATVGRVLAALGLGTAGDAAAHGQAILLGDDRPGRFTYSDGLADPDDLIRTLAEAGAAADPSARWFGNAPLLDQKGRVLRLYEDVLKDRLVLMTFVFTGCDETCPLVADTLRRVHEALGPSASGVRFVAITVDPDNDGPEQMAAFARAHGLPDDMLLLTGKPDEVRAATRRLGGCAPPLFATGRCLSEDREHLALFLIGDVAAVHWQKLPATASPDEVLDVLRHNFLPRAKG